MVEILQHGLRQPALEAETAAASEFNCQLGRIDRVAVIMTGSGDN